MATAVTRFVPWSSQLGFELYMFAEYTYVTEKHPGGQVQGAPDSQNETPPRCDSAIDKGTRRPVSATARTAWFTLEG